MKKIFSLLLTLTMVLSLAACGGNSAAPSTPGGDSSNTGSDTASDSDTIKIGYVSDLTGATALWGTAGQYGRRACYQAGQRERRRSGWQDAGAGPHGR